MVGGVLRGQLLDEGNHRGDVFSGAGNDLGLLDLEGIEVFEEGLFEAGGVVADGYPGSGGVADDLVVHVGDVHDVAGGDSLQLEEAAEDVDLEERPEVADVAVVVDGGPAGVHAECLAVDGCEFFDAAGEGVEESNGHSCGGRGIQLKFPADCSRFLFVASAEGGTPYPGHIAHSFQKS